MEELSKNLNNQPLITTIIPTYRRPELLRRAVSSVLHQTYSNLRVCIYDNASGDGTKEVAEALMRQDPRVHYYCHPQNIGAFSNFNFGIKRVDTPYFSLCADDDILLPDFYAKAMEGFTKYPDAIFSATQTITAKDKRVIDVSFADYEEKLYCPMTGLLKIAEGGTNTWTGSLYRKEVVEAIGLDEVLAEGPAEQDFLLRIAARYSYVVSSSPGAIFIVHDSSVSASRREVDAIGEYLRMINKIKNNKSIPASVSEAVCKKIETDIVASSWQGGWIDIKQRNFARAKRIAHSLNQDFGENTKSTILYIGVKLCEFSSLFYYVFLGLNQARKIMNIKRKTREQNLQEAYGAYLNYLEKYSE